MTRLLLAAVILLAAPAASAQEEFPPPFFSKAFAPSTIGPGSATVLTFGIDNTNGPAPVTDLAFTDVLPAGVTIATPALASTTCSGSGDGGAPVLSAPGGGTTISLSGAGVGAGAACEVSVLVTSATPGTHTNTSGDLTSSAGNSGPAEAGLTVATDRPGFTKSFSPAAIARGGRSTLTFTLDNALNDSPVSAASFTDTLPTGLVVASPSNLATTCESAPAEATLTAASGGQTIEYNYFVNDSFPAVAAGATCTVTVDVIANGVGRLANVSSNLQTTVSFTSRDGGLAVATLDVTGAALTLTKAFDGPARPGGTATLTFDLDFTDRSAVADNILFSDDLDAMLAGATAVGLPVAACGGTLDGTSTIALTGGALPAGGGSCSFSVDVLIPSDATPGTYTNATSPVFADIDGTRTLFPGASALLEVTIAPVLTKEFIDDPVSGGQTVAIEYTILNPSSTEAATGIAFDDVFAYITDGGSASLPTDGFCGPSSTAAFVPAINPGGSGTPTPARLEVRNAELAAEASCTFTVDLDLPLGLPGGVYPDPTEPVTATVGGAVTGEAATDDLYVVAAPTLRLAFIDDPVVPGDAVTARFTIELTDEAPSDATGIAFDFSPDLVGPGIYVDPADLPVAGCGGTLMMPYASLSARSAGSAPLEFVGGTLAPGETCSLDLPVQTPVGLAAGTYPASTSPLSATVAGVAVTGTAGEDDLLVTPLRFRKAFLSAGSPGAAVVVRYGIVNLSPSSAASDLSFIDQLNVGFSDASFGVLPTQPCGSGSSVADFGNGFLFMSGGTLAAGESCVFDVPLLLPSDAEAGEYPSTSSALSGSVGGASVTAPGAFDVLTVVTGVPVFSKAFVGETILAGGTSRLTFTIDNSANGTDATGLAFTDSFPVGLRVATPAVHSTTCGSGVVTAAAGSDEVSLADGSVSAGGTCTVAVEVTADEAGTYENTTSALSSSLGTSEASTATLTVIDPDLYASKAVAFVVDRDNDGNADSGDVLGYTVTITNRTASAIDGVVYTDTPSTYSTLAPATVTTDQGTVTTGGSAGDTDLVVDVGTLAPGASVVISYRTGVDDPLSEEAAVICNQGEVQVGRDGAVTDDPDTPAMFDATCVDAVRPVVDAVITEATYGRGEAIRVTASFENTTDAEVTYRRRLFVTRPNGNVLAYPATEATLAPGETVGPLLVTPEISLPSAAPAGTYVVELHALIVGSTAAGDVERFEFTLPPASISTAPADSQVRLGAGPNPFSAQTTIRYLVEEAGPVELRVFDALGREVAVLQEGALAEGVHEAVLDGSALPTGVYLWRLHTGDAVTTGSVTLAR